MTLSDMLSQSLPQLVYATSVLADEFPRGRKAHLIIGRHALTFSKHPHAVMSVAYAKKGKAELNSVSEDLQEAVRKCQ
jgi:hypothetical protein